MKFSRLLIIVAAAAAGFACYKARIFVAGPDGDPDSSHGFYSNVTGSGSLAETYSTANAERKSTLSDEDYPKATSAHPLQNNAMSKHVGASPPVDEIIRNDFPLLDAAAKGDTKKIGDRLAAGAKVDSRDDARRTPLMYAAWNNHSDICERLLAAGANPELEDRAGNNTFDYAAGRGLVGMVDFLLKRTHSSDDRHYAEYAGLIQAAYAGDVAKLPPGTGKLTSVNRINPEGQSPLFIAAANNSTALIEALIDRGADVNITNASRQTPLQWAAWDNRPDVAQLLIKHGADMSKADLAGNTPLILAVQNGSTHAARLLISHGANKYAANKQGKTAGIIAEDKNSKELADLLK